MASNNVLQQLLNILDGSYSSEEEKDKLTSLKQFCEGILEEHKSESVQRLPVRVHLCDFAKLQFPHSQEHRASNHYPVRTSGDGNCLYNACSIALSGNENLATYLRCLTSIELCMNASYYSSHPLIKEQHNKGAFVSEANAFAMCLSDVAHRSFTREDPDKAVVAEAYNNGHNHQYSSFLCLLSLSSALNFIIESYYPISMEDEQGHTGGDAKDSLACMFNSTIFPRGASGEYVPQNKRIHIFRCASLPLDYLETTAIPQRKNHYVALCQPESQANTCTCEDEFLIKPLLTSICFDSTTVTSGRKKSINPYPLEQSSSAIPKSGEAGRFKQLLLDRLVTRKRKFFEDVNLTPQQTEVMKIPATSKTAAAPSVSSGSTRSRFPNDIGNFVNLTTPLTDQKKYHVLCNVWKPDPAYTFPVGVRGRRFRHQWLGIKEFSWLAYSEVLGGAFCINCVLFGARESTHNGSKLVNFFIAPFTTWDVAHRKHP